MEQDLRRLLDELDVAIDRTREGHEDEKELARLVDAVSRRLRAEVEEDENNALVEALERSAARFEADHPTLAVAIRRAVDVLSASGI